MNLRARVAPDESGPPTLLLQPIITRLAGIPLLGERPAPAEIIGGRPVLAGGDGEAPGPVTAKSPSPASRHPINAPYRISSARGVKSADSRLFVASQPMTTHASLDRFDLASLGCRCAEQTELYRQRKSSDAAFCYELFRRAIERRDREAWACVHDTYRSELEGWVRRFGNGSLSAEDIDDLTQESFEHFFRAFQSGKLSFQRFPTLQQLLGYFRTCALACVIDELRKRKRRLPSISEFLNALEVDPDDDGADIPDYTSPSVAARAEGAVLAESLWPEIAARLKTEKERLAIYEMFGPCFRPREIHKRHPDLFRDAMDVSRTWANVVVRLSRDDVFRRKFAAFIGAEEMVLAR